MGNEASSYLFCSPVWLVCISSYRSWPWQVIFQEESTNFRKFRFLFTRRQTAVWMGPVYRLLIVSHFRVVVLFARLEIFKAIKMEAMFSSVILPHHYTVS